MRTNPLECLKISEESFSSLQPFDIDAANNVVQVGVVEFDLFLRQTHHQNVFVTWR